ncbi:uncharacterized protein Tco025E_03474 [Trypanosoma conorhini]|uniref:Uncharacterized protein n=1 Tax=Trypanosoma conorhini TaxID=83891 RepID=A0A3R7L7N9_9TRYP|nr:uncharacterized protein Tco025E_03474 [Trypanosoma conorhini]RNF21424.1 hypothetical protein Tco025E_03474 [Trypanosoma conorhini]
MGAQTFPLRRSRSRATQYATSPECITSLKTAPESTVTSRGTSTAAAAAARTPSSGERASSGRISSSITHNSVLPVTPQYLCQLTEKQLGPREDVVGHVRQKPPPAPP